ncbi:MAG: ATP-binding protein, partial [Ignavibacteriae bacterium]|nr:ATP-binding protein [Ignavibacteriota bacterium]
TKNFPGSGLGLSITKKFIELLNGSIHISSKKDFGTSIIVKLPINN